MPNMIMKLNKIATGQKIVVCANILGEHPTISFYREESLFHPSGDFKYWCVIAVGKSPDMKEITNSSV